MCISCKSKKKKKRVEQRLNSFFIYTRIYNNDTFRFILLKKKPQKNKKTQRISGIAKDNWKKKVIELIRNFFISPSSYLIFCGSNSSAFAFATVRFLFFSSSSSSPDFIRSFFTILLHPLDLT